jgi:hypothetical protein
MSALAFDTYAAVKKLKEAGFTEQQAEAQTALLTNVIAGELATKHDIETVKHDIETVKLDIENVRAELKRDIEALRADMKHDMKELELRLTIKLGAMLALAVGAVATLVKLL